ncbi:hypothetical protein DPMN_058183 [Dreissena polymorpha]|uniref:Uncharacterized protein n=1 Tax=Dreissena polymorpha TaxID=45954 RepID=A0A9D4HD91_DREPO|nr:hypothetical protein DPMN_058183 [Dreissena polymorpha]
MDIPDQKIPVYIGIFYFLCSISHLKTLSRIRQNYPYHNRRDQHRKSTRPRKSTFHPSRSQTAVLRQVRQA